MGERRETTVGIFSRREFQAEGTAAAKTMRKTHTLYVNIVRKTGVLSRQNW